MKLRGAGFDAPDTNTAFSMLNQAYIAGIIFHESNHS
jgi:hypothetical protein